MTAVTRGLGPDSLKARCSNDGAEGIDKVVVLILWRCIVAIPPPVLFSRGLSRYVYPGGAV